MRQLILDLSGAFIKPFSSNKHIFFRVLVGNNYQ